MESSGQSHDRYAYYRDLSYEELRRQLLQLEAKAEAALRRATEANTLTEADKRELEDCIGELMPMSHNKSVQAEAIGEIPPPEDELGPTFDRISQLMNRILLFLSTFEDSGVTRLEGPIDLF